MSLNDYPKWAEELGAAIVEAGKDRELLLIDVENLRKREEKLRDLLVKLAQSKVTASKEIQHALDRLYRFSELRNMCEHGAFTINLEHALTAAYRKLP
jgi:predicted transcriptional regulator